MQLDLLTNLLDKIRKDAAEANKHMDASLLTEDQKFAIAYLTGIDFTSTYDEKTGKLNLQTEPCAVTTDGKSWTVIVTKLKG